MPPPFDLLFIPGAAGTGQRLCVHHAPAGRVTALVVYLHPLAEEMNKSRRMAARQARALAAAGCAVLQIDLRGCGDSSGDFADASWAGWLDDAALALQWLQQRHGNQAPVWFWGLRAGALLAVQAAAAAALQPAAPRINLLLWQPPASGKAMLQQFLRLKTAAEMIGGAAAAVPAVASAPSDAQPARGGVESLRRQLQDGRRIDVAGYVLSPALALGLDAATMNPPTLLSTPAPWVDADARSVWMEVSTRDPATLLPASQARIDAWVAAGVAVEAHAVSGPAFWQTQEIEDAPALLQATVALVTQPVLPGAAAAADPVRVAAAREAA